MSSTEPPSRIPPRRETPETKAERDELSSKGKVEKVREVDADEARKKKKWRAAFYEEDQLADIESAADKRPSPFDLVSQTPPSIEGIDKKGSLGSSSTYQPRSDMGDMEDSIIPSPSYSSPPDVSANLPDDEEEDSATAGALPQSDDFWEEVDLPPDHPLSPNNYQETQSSSSRMKGTDESSSEILAGGKKQKGKKGPTTAGAAGEGKKEVGAAPKSKDGSLKTGKESSPFGAPGKPSSSATGPQAKGTVPAEKNKTARPPSLFEEAAKATPRGKFTEEEKRYLGPGREETKPQKKAARERAEEAATPGAMPMHMRPEEREGGEERGKDRKIAEIEITSLPHFPGEIQNSAMAATQQATTYLHPSTVSLFFQMVGTMYVMSAPPGIARTEIVLNNPAYAGSRFFGSTITIEKYATAPDSFNITLTGSNEAVVAFRENIPSLMAAFQQGHFAFKVNRLDVQYEKPVFHRKEKREEKGGTGGDDLGERRK